jgi:hypothetical protein
MLCGRAQYVLPFTFGLWAAQVEYFDDDPLDLDEGTPCTPPVRQRRSVPSGVAAEAKTARHAC